MVLEDRHKAGEGFARGSRRSLGDDRLGLPAGFPRGDLGLERFSVADGQDRKCAGDNDGGRDKELPGAALRVQAQELQVKFLFPEVTSASVDQACIRITRLPPFDGFSVL